MKVFSGIISLFLLSILCSCENDLEVNAPWIETPVVYGLMDITKTTQYIRIEKTYQNSIDLSTGEGAQIADSLYFDTLDVKVRDNTGSIIQFIRVSMPKKPGFFTPVNYVYQSKTPFNISAGKTYTLQIYNPRSGKKYASTTQIVDSAVFVRGGNSITVNLPDATGNMGNLRFRFRAGTNAAIYDTYMRFKYAEYRGGDSVIKSIDYILDKNWLVQESEKPYVVKVSDYVAFLRKNIPSNGSVTRYFRGIDYYATGGSQDVRFMVDLSKPSETIVQKKPQYSNVEGGLGIFSSYAVKVYSPGMTEENKRNLVTALDDRQFVYP